MSGRRQGLGRTLLVVAAAILVVAVGGPAGATQERDERELQVAALRGLYATTDLYTQPDRQGWVGQYHILAYEGFGLESGSQTSVQGSGLHATAMFCLGGPPPDCRITNPTVLELVTDGEGGGMLRVLDELAGEVTLTVVPTSWTPGSLIQRASSCCFWHTWELRSSALMRVGSIPVPVSETGGAAGYGALYGMVGSWFVNSTTAEFGPAFGAANAFRLARVEVDFRWQYLHWE